jgi:hypothetical protein
LATPATGSHAENNNRAAAACTGDIVSWFDADDRMHPRRTGEGVHPVRRYAWGSFLIR